ncbi:hydroxymethylglutaryl-CoA lyase [bacterium A37T11]|nr:hydroxymethylglutaryl-CoA lyase [bacterium A37T11]
MIRITECPRDAMQGIVPFIPTEVKVKYLNLLLKIGFDRLDFGSFVSPRAIPQLSDTAKVLEKLDLTQTNTTLLAIVANLRGVEEALSHDEIGIIGFPFSVSETFQIRNTNTTIAQSLSTVASMADLCLKANRLPLVYLSMAFGNPYGDEWNADIVMKYAEKLLSLGIKDLVLADTTGSSDSDKIRYLYPLLSQAFPTANWGLHLHSFPKFEKDLLETALSSGCVKFDTALGGYGGCPMAQNKLTGNVATETLVSLLRAKDLLPPMNLEAWKEARDFCHYLFHEVVKG